MDEATRNSDLQLPPRQLLHELCPIPSDELFGKIKKERSEKVKGKMQETQ